MIRLFALGALLVTGLGLAAAPPPGLPQDGKGTPLQECQQKCGQAMTSCMVPCTGGNPDEAAKPENRSKVMACVKKCAEAQAPCMSGCSKQKK